MSQLNTLGKVNSYRIYRKNVYMGNCPSKDPSDCRNYPTLLSEQDHCDELWKNKISSQLTIQQLPQNFSNLGNNILNK